MNVLVNQHEYHTTLTIKNHFLKSISKRQLQKNEVTDFLNTYQDIRTTNNCYIYELINKAV